MASENWHLYTNREGVFQGPGYTHTHTHTQKEKTTTKEELLYINLFTSTALIILNYTFVNGLMRLSRQVNKSICALVDNQNKDILCAHMEFCDVS